PPPTQYLVHKSLAANRRHVAASYWTAASDVAPTSARSSPSINDGQRRRSMTVNAADHRSTAVDHGGDRRSTVAVNDGRRWRTTVDCRWTTVDHHRTTGQRWLVGWSTLGTGPVWIGPGPGLDQSIVKKSERGCGHVTCHAAEKAKECSKGTMEWLKKHERRVGSNKGKSS
nr:hypothetical protein [Tanacetum cinerariifolium]